jgi:hypothetical protein
LREIVFAYKDVEDEPYTICRFMRPTKFAAPEMLQRLEQNKAVWEAAEKQSSIRMWKRPWEFPFHSFNGFTPFSTKATPRMAAPSTISRPELFMWKA